MKRLEHIRTLRNRPSRSQANNPNGSVMRLAQISQEKHRLQQERGNWERRIQKIDARLKEIAKTEKELIATVRLGRATHRTAPTSLREFTVRY